MNQRNIFIGAVIVLMLAFFAATVWYVNQAQNNATQLASVNQESLERPHSMTVGKVNAPVVIVEFFDPACETCSAFYPRVKELMKQHPDKIRLVLRYAPFHPGSDKVIAVLEAARKQDKFWPALEALLANQSQWVIQHRADVALVWKPLESLGLNMEQMAFDMTAPEIQHLIQQDLLDARTLNVTKTPEFFVNGKPLPSFGFEQLSTLVNQELAH